MGKGVLKYGGKSGILPKVRPVFKRHPIRPLTEQELAKENKVEQGFAEGVPLPKKTGFTFERVPPPKPVVTVEERIRKTIEERVPADIDESKLSKEEVWELKRNEIRRDYLKQAYLAEAERSKRLDAYRAEEEEKKKVQAEASDYQESDAERLTLPTLDSYLDGPIMRPRTDAEELIVQEQRLLNRKTNELHAKESKANNLLDLYHAASNFITTEDELEVAIKEAFEVNFSKFDGSQSIIESRLASTGSGYANIDYNERVISDHVLGELNGKPGFQTVRDTLSGELEQLKREAQLAINK